jgi:hypothetical protein
VMMRVRVRVMVLVRGAVGLVFVIHFLENYGLKIVDFSP